jgi:hypothetical protein
MSYSTKTIKKDATGKNPVPQYFNTDADDYEPLEGSDGAPLFQAEDGKIATIGAKADVAVSDGSSSASVVALLKGIQTLVGAKTDAASTGDGSLIAVVKQLRTILNDVWDGANDSLKMQLTGSLPTVTTATIANGASLSAAADLGQKTLVGIEMPAGWTAANLTFQVSDDNVTYNDIYDNAGIELTMIAAASRYIIATPANWIGVRYVKVRSGTAGSPVNQGAARDIKLISKAV